MPGILPDLTQIGSFLQQQNPGAPGPSLPDPSPIQAQLQGVAQQAQSNIQPVPPAGPDQGSPVKRFLTNFLYGAGQGALQHVGLPTDYDKQQQALLNNQRQQEIAQHAQETASLVGMHQQMVSDAQQKAQQEAHDNEEVATGNLGQSLLGVPVGTKMPRKMYLDAIQKKLEQKAQYRAPLSTPQGYFNLDTDGHATPILGPDNKPLMPAKQDKPDTPEQQYLDEYQRTHPGAGVAQAVSAYSAATKQPMPLTVILPQPDGSGKVVAARPGQTIDPNAQTPSDFSKRSATYQKLTAPLDAAAASADDAHHYAAMNNGTGDAALVLRYADAIKPDKGFRLTNTELNLFMHSRSLYGNGQALLERVQAGGLLTPEQRQDMLNIIDMKAGHAKQMKDYLSREYGKYAGQETGGPPAPNSPMQPVSGGADPFAAFGGKSR